MWTVQPKNQAGWKKTSLLLVIFPILITAVSCGQSKTGNSHASNETAIAVAVQTMNAQATSTANIGAETTSDQVATVHPMVENTPPVTPSESFDRIISFSGHDWRVKTSVKPVGPGPNYFSDSAENVWVDESGQLHLKLRHKGDKWYCAEVVTAEPLGYGGYQFKISSKANILDKYAVLGLFTWDTAAPQYNYREIDVELSKWGEDGDLNAQFVVQPWDHPNNRRRFSIDPDAEASTHIFYWTPENIQFLSFLGNAQSPEPEDIVNNWSYSGGDVPPAGPGNARINLWLIGGQTPSNEQEIEVVISSFEYIPFIPTQ